MKDKELNRYESVEDVLSQLPEDAKELFMRNAQFNACIEGVLRGSNPLHMIYELCKSNNHYQKKCIEYIEKYGSI